MNLRTKNIVLTPPYFLSQRSNRRWRDGSLTDGAAASSQVADILRIDLLNNGIFSNEIGSH